MSKNPFEQGKIVEASFADLQKPRNVKEEVFGQREPSDFFNYVRDNWDIEGRKVVKENSVTTIKYLTLKEILEMYKHHLSEKEIRGIMDIIEQGKK